MLHMQECCTEAYSVLLLRVKQVSRTCAQDGPAMKQFAHKPDDATAMHTAFVSFQLWLALLQRVHKYIAVQQQ